MKTYLDWSAYCDAGMGDAYADIPKLGGNFAKAVAVCINSRQCENTDRGVMCPSYRVTGNTSFTTGGRVRLLKRVLNSDDSNELASDPELAATMDLCISCKGCKRECENNVDMAQIKIEYLAQRHALRGVPLRTRLFAHLPRWLHRHAWLKRVIVLRNRHSLLSRLGEKLLGISARSLPLPTDTPFTEKSSNGNSADRPTVVLFVDTFTRYFEPEIIQSALIVLDKAGYHVVTVAPSPDDSEPQRPLCCGRSYLAQGLIEEARFEARRVVSALAPYVAQNYPVIGLEPSCLLALRDDYRGLDLGKEAEAIFANVWLLEEFLARELQAGRATLQFTSAENDAPILVHGHCHQKAVGAMKSMRKLLNRLPDSKVTFIEASCCGMAGSFGHEAEHSELSTQMAEQSLLPALRAQGDATVIANGFSCRQQIREGSAHQPQHMVQILAERIAGS